MQFLNNSFNSQSNAETNVFCSSGVIVTWVCLLKVDLIGAPAHWAHPGPILIIRKEFHIHPPTAFQLLFMLVQIIFLLIDGR